MHCSIKSSGLFSDGRTDPFVGHSWGPCGEGCYCIGKADQMALGSYGFLKCRSSDSRRGIHTASDSSKKKRLKMPLL